MIKIMSWSKVILFFLLASSSVCSSINNYVDKYYFERDGKHYFNIFALKKLNIVLDAEILDSFNFKSGYDGASINCGVPPVELWMSTSAAEKDVHFRVEEFLMDIEFPPPIPKHSTYIFSFSLAIYYQDYHLNFLQESGKNVLKIETKYAPEVDIQHCSFLFVWPETAHFRIPPAFSTELEPPNSEYEVFDDACHPADRRRCDILKSERGVSFPEKGVIQFLPYLVDKNKEYEIFHPPGDYSPIYTIDTSPSCNNFNIKLTFSNLGLMDVKREGEKLDIKIHMGREEQSFQKMNISKECDVKFYFEEDLLHFYFYETKFWMDLTYSAFHLATFVLKTPINGTQTQTKIQIDYGEIGLECASIVRLVIGKNVTLLIPFPPEINSTTVAMTSTAATASAEEIKVTSSTTETAVASAGLPLGAFIGIGCFCLLLLLIAIAVGIYLIIRCLRKRKSQTTPPTTMDVSFNFTENELPTSNSTKSVGATSKKSETTAIPEAVKKFRTNEEIELARKEARRYEVKIDSNEPEETPSKNFKPFALVEFKLYLTAAFFAMREFYEENPMEEKDTGIIPTKGTLVNNFWELFPFIKNDKQKLHQRVTEGPNNYMFFVVRDLTSPDNKMFHKLGARLFEPINDNDYEVLANQENGKRDPVIVRVFILSHDPPGVECIVNGRCPEFFFDLFKCQLCKNVKPEHFTSKEKLSRCLHSLPLGHHIVASYSDEKDFKNANSHKTILTFKGGRQSIPLDMKHGCPSIHYTQNIKLRGQKLAKVASVKIEEKTKSVISIVNSAASTTGSIKQKTDEEK